MNMPFELGIDYGSRQHGPSFLRDKKCLILEEKAFDFKKALSDLSGVDIKSHSNEPDEVVRAVRDWFLETVGVPDADRTRIVWYRFTDFTTSLYEEGLALGIPEDHVAEDIERMPVTEYLGKVRDWIADNRATW